MKDKYGREVTGSTTLGDLPPEAQEKLKQLVAAKLGATSGSPADLLAAMLLSKVTVGAQCLRLAKEDKETK